VTGVRIILAMIFTLTIKGGASPTNGDFGNFSLGLVELFVPPRIESANERDALPVRKVLIRLRTTAESQREDVSAV
jgi:hypothetical protein